MVPLKNTRRRFIALLCGHSLFLPRAWTLGMLQRSSDMAAGKSDTGGDGRPLDQSSDSGTAAEKLAGITPADYTYPASPANVRRYGAALDGRTNDVTALSAALAVGGAQSFTIVVDGPMALASSVKIPAHVTIEFIMNGALVVAGGQTVSFDGIVHASPTYIFQGLGSVAFSVNKQRTFYAEWWGAKGDSVTDDSAALNAALAQVSSAQATLQLVGAYVHKADLAIPANTEITGYGKSFGTKLIPTGKAEIVFNSISIRSALRRCAIELSACTGTNGIRFTGGAYNCVVEDVFVHGLNKNADNTVGIAIGLTLNTVLNRVSVFGSGARIPHTGISVGSGALGVQLLAPDVEACVYGFQVTGTAQCDIITPYIERCSGYSIYLSRNGAGGCMISGGEIEVANSTAIGIAIAPNCGNISIYGTTFTLNGGTGITSHGAGTVSNVSIYGVDAANIFDPNNYFYLYGIGGAFTATLATGGTSAPTVTGSWSRNGKSVTLSLPALAYTSNGPGMTVSGVPKLAQPISAQYNYCSVTDSGIATTGEVSSTAGGTLIFFKGQARIAASFTNSGIKGFGEFSITYTLE
jgi:hypothetical protein